jgi:predicted Ser/Thr protein kinase
MRRCGTCGLDIADSATDCPACAATRAEAIATGAAATPVRSARLTSSHSGAFSPGEMFASRYRIVSLLGRGGMGEVYRADDLTLDQPVALKLLPGELAANPDVIARFRAEVRIARQVSHPNVCRVYDAGEADGRYFLSMEYIDGEDLGSLLRRIGRLPADKAIDVARRLCAGLAAAHEKGVLHRDLKPGNIMIDGRGQVILTDFGLAALAGQIEGAEVRSGTPAYMAPEQLSGREVTARSDIYSLGLVLYEIFTGKRPFERDTLAGIMQARKQATPVTPSSLVHDLDPMVERVILRCLEPDPARRPASALAVAAALPGGDPLAAALAAGETPSPQMIAAAGEGRGLAPRFATPAFIAVLAGLALISTLAQRSSTLERVHPPYPPEVLAQKARDIAERIGYNARADEGYDFDWDHEYAALVEKEHANVGDRPTPLVFWYRSSPYPMTAGEFHNDRLTPGLLTPDDPAPILSGMIDMRLDPRGRLLSFETIPPQRQEPAKATAAVDWSPLFSAAAIDPGALTATEPLWTWLATSDTRAAWTGTRPGTNRPLRVEAAALRGQPVAFALIGPWTTPSRMPPLEPPMRDRIAMMILIALAFAVCIGAAFVARHHLKQGRSDRRGAIRIAAFVFYAQLAIWVCQAHLTASIGTVATSLVAACTALFYGAVMWTIYIAIEPYVRRFWPQTLMSWSSVLTGKVRDPIVGRDLLSGIGLGILWVLVSRLGDRFAGASGGPQWLAATDFLLGVRATLGGILMHVPGAVRGTLMMFFLLFGLRVLLRSAWLGGAAFTAIFTCLAYFASRHPVIDSAEAIILYALAAVVVVRLGLLALATGIFLDGLLMQLPVTADISAWYFSNTALVLLAVAALAAWAFYISMPAAQQSRDLHNPYGV